MPLSVYREHFEPNIRTKAKAQMAPLSVSTSLYVNMEIARDLHMSLEQFHKLSRKERKMWVFFRILSNAKEAYAFEESKEKAEREAQFNQQSSNPGIPNRFR